MIIKLLVGLFFFCPFYYLSQIRNRDAKYIVIYRINSFHKYRMYTLKYIKTLQYMILEIRPQIHNIRYLTRRP